VPGLELGDVLRGKFGLVGGSWCFRWAFSVRPLRLGLVVAERLVDELERGWLVVVTAEIVVAVVVGGRGVVVGTWLGLRLRGDGLVERVVDGGVRGLRLQGVAVWFVRRDVVGRESLFDRVGLALLDYVELVVGKLVRKLLVQSVGFQLDLELFFVGRILGLFGSIGLGGDLVVLGIVRRSCSFVRSITF
jgi:hypothetical protein